MLFIEYLLVVEVTKKQSNFMKFIFLAFSTQVVGNRHSRHGTGIVGTIQA